MTHPPLPKKKAFENIVGKGENASNQHFRLFQQYFLPVPTQNSIFQSQLFFHLQIKNFSYVKELINYQLHNSECEHPCENIEFTSSACG